MSSEAITALEKSIEHWKENLAAESYREADTGADKCALCANYIDNMCSDCPIAEYTGERVCANTPYIKADKALKDWRYLVIQTQPRDVVKQAKERFRAYAKAEVEFLEMLLLREKIKEGV